MLATIMLVTTLSADTGGSKLEWKRGGKMSRPTAGKPSFVRQTGQQPVPTASATQINPLRASRHVDSFVRPTAFEEESGPRFAEASANGAPGRSVIVERDDPQDAMRSAQLPSGGAGANSTSAQGGAATPPDALGTSDTLTPPADLETPAIDTTQLPPLEEPATPGLETPPLPQDTQSPPEDQMRQPVQPPAGQPSPQMQPRVPPRIPPRDVPGRALPPTPKLSEQEVEKERQKSQDACQQGMTDLREKTIDKLSLTIAVTGEPGSDYPYECTLGEGEWHGGRCWEQTTYMWKASALCHKPLYFEDEQLERYGHSHAPCLQPFVSGAHFFTRLPVLPYCMGVEPPCECVYALGHYRPGNCAPYMCNPIPISPRGALIQAGAVTGAAAALP
jgi:hypothetical protein